MSLLTGLVINHARDMNPALSRENAPPVVGYRALTRFVGGLVQEVAPRQAGFLAKEAVIALPLPVFAAGISLETLLPEGWLDLVDLFARFTSSASSTTWPTRCENVPWAQRDMAQPFPAFTLRDDTLFLLGDESSWNSIASLKLSYTPQPAPLTGDNSIIPLPPDALDALATMLCAFYLWRLVGDPAYRVTGDMASLWDGKARDERKAFLERIQRTGQRQSFRVRDVM
jgi:hypothetical protein